MDEEVLDHGEESTAPSNNILNEFGCCVQSRSRATQTWIQKRFGNHPFNTVLRYWSLNSECYALRSFNAKGVQTGALTYNQLYRRAICVSKILYEDYSVTTGDRVILSFTPGIEFVVGFLGCLLLGVISIPAYPPDPRKGSDIARFQRIVDRCTPKIIFTNSFYLKVVGIKRPTFYISSEKSFLEDIQRKRKQFKLPWVTLSSTWYKKYDEALTWTPPLLNLQQIVLIQFTSGSTRDPEGITIPYEGLIYNIHACIVSMSGIPQYMTTGNKENVDNITSSSSILGFFDIHKNPLEYLFDYAIQRQRLQFSQSGHHIRFATWLPLYHDMGLIGSLLSGLFSGSELLMLSPLDFLNNPPLWLSLMSDFHCAGTATPNFGLDLIVRKVSPELLKSLDLTTSNQSGYLCGAEPIRISSLLQFIKKFKDCGVLHSSLNLSYGLAENTLCVTSMGFECQSAEPLIISVDSQFLQSGQKVCKLGGPWRLGQFELVFEQYKRKQNEQFCVSCGVPPPEFDVRIIDPSNLREVPVGTTGEVWISSPSAAVGYWNCPELTRERLYASFILLGDDKNAIVDHLTIWSPAQYIRSGDLGFVLPFPIYNSLQSSSSVVNSRTHLFIVGRLKDTLIVRGKNFHAKDIEQAIEEQFSSIVRGGRVAAFCVSSNSEDQNRLVVMAEIRPSQLKEGLEAQKLSTQILGVSARPPSGEVGHQGGTLSKKWGFIRSRRLESANSEALREFAKQIKQLVLQDVGVKLDTIVLLRPHSLPVTSSGKIRRQEAKKQYEKNEMVKRELFVLDDNEYSSITEENKVYFSTEQMATPEDSKKDSKENAGNMSTEVIEIMKLISDCLLEFRAIDNEQYDRLVREFPNLQNADENLTSPNQIIMHDHAPGDLISPYENYSNFDVPNETPTQPYDSLSFDNLNIDSLAAVELAGIISQRLNVDLPPTCLFDFPTLPSLGQYIHRSRHSEIHLKSSLCRLPISSVSNTTFAIIGASCRVPSGTGFSCRSLSSFWDRILKIGTDTVICRDLSTHPSPDSFGSFLRYHDLFSRPSQHLPISEIEWQSMDPHQRLVLTVSIEAFVSADLTSEALVNSNFAVFVGCCSSFTTEYQNSHHFSLTSSLRASNSLMNVPSRTVSSLTVTSCAPSIIANRLSYVLAITGPSLVIDCSCSSSLVAVDAAIRYLSTCETAKGALISGVNLMLSRDVSRSLANMKALASDGRCKTFSASADGYGRGEACVSIVVIPWDVTARTDPHEISPLAFIRGSVVNQDGRSAALTVPNGPSQSRLLNEALTTAKLDPSKVTYIECHGTGTKVGDPIEVNAIRHVYQNRTNPLHLGAVKTNVGHSEGAAGIVGLLKLVLTLGLRYIPPVVHLTKLNPLIDLDPFSGVIRQVYDSVQMLEEGRPLFGGVSSFGFGGTNAHVLIQGFDEPQGITESENECNSDVKGKDFAVSSMVFYEKILAKFNERDVQVEETTIERQWKISNRLDGVFASPLNHVNGLAEISSAEIKKITKDLVQSVLQQHLDDIPLDTSLIDLGLDSLAVTELALTLSQQFGLDLPSTTLFNYPTLSSLTDRIIELIDLTKSGREKECEGQSTNLINLDPRPWENPQEFAIVAAACRFPGQSNSLSEFWDMLWDRRLKNNRETMELIREEYDSSDCIVPVPLTRWNHVKNFLDSDETKVGKTYVAEGGFLLSDVVEGFDCQYFGLNHSESEAMDPNQRLMLTVAAELLHRSSCHFESVNKNLLGKRGMNIPGERVGVFIGFANSEWPGLCSSPSTLSTYSATGMGPSLIAGRISYQFGLKGPSIVIDTACSSSLVAIDVALTHLNNESIDHAIVGGVSVMLSPNPFVMLSRNGMLAKDGRCRSFDSKASGYGRGEGCGAVMLYKKSYCEIPILATVRSSSVNHDGRSASLTAPNGIAQQRVIMEALRKSNLKPSDIASLEAHGTGTNLGDPIEVEAIANVFSSNDRKTPLVIGAVKSNIGHLEACAGIAGFIKAVLVSSTNRMPSICHFQQLNPLINQVLQGNTQIRFSSREIQNEILFSKDSYTDAFRHSCKNPIVSMEGDNIVRVGISSFSMCGTNAHVIVEGCRENVTNRENIDSKVTNNVFKHDEPNDVTLSSYKIGFFIELDSELLTMSLEPDDDSFKKNERLVKISTLWKRHIALYNITSYRVSIYHILNYLRTIDVPIDVPNIKEINNIKWDELEEPNYIESLSNEQLSVLYLMLILYIVQYFKLKLGFPEIVVLGTNTSTFEGCKRKCLLEMLSLIEEIISCRQFETSPSTPCKIPIRRNECNSDISTHQFLKEISMNLHVNVYFTNSESVDKINVAIENDTDGHYRLYTLDSDQKHYYNFLHFNHMHLFNPIDCYPWWPSIHPLLDSHAPMYESTIEITNEKLRWNIESSNSNVFHSLFAHHLINGESVIPAAGYIELLAASIIRRAFIYKSDSKTQIVMKDVQFMKPYKIEDLRSDPLELVQQRPRTSSKMLNYGDELEMRIQTRKNMNKPLKSFVAAIGLVTSESGKLSLPLLSNASGAPSHITPKDLYERLASIGISYGSNYRTVEQIRLVSESSVLFTLRSSHNLADYERGLLFDPALLDGAFQASSSLLLFNQHEQSMQLMLPSMVKQISIAIKNSTLFSHALHSIDQQAQHFSTLEYLPSLRQKLDTQSIVYIGYATLKLPLIQLINSNHIPIDISVFSVRQNLDFNFISIQEIFDNVITDGFAVHIESLIWSRVLQTRFVKSIIEDVPKFSDDEQYADALHDSTNGLWVETLVPYIHVTTEEIQSMNEGLVHRRIIVIDPPDGCVNKLKTILFDDSIQTASMSDIDSHLEKSITETTPPFVFYFKKANSENLVIVKDLIKLFQIISKHGGWVKCVAVMKWDRPNSEATFISGISGLLRAAHLELEATFQTSIPICLYDINDSVDLVEVMSDTIGQIETRNKQIESEIVVRSDGWKCVRIVSYDKMDDGTVLRAITSEGNAQNGMVGEKSQNGTIALEHEDAMDKCWVISGGCGSLGQTVTRFILNEMRAKERRIKCILLTRKNPSEVHLSQDLELKRIHSPFTETETNQNVLVMQCNVMLRKNVEVLFWDIIKEWGWDIVGVVHAAGILADGSIPNLNEKQIEDVWNVKALGAENLDLAWRTVASDKSGLLIFFSSTASLVGNFGQCNYAAANSYLDSYARKRRQQGFPTLSIQWGPWKVGMASTVADVQRRAGINLIDEKEGTKVFGDLVKNVLEKMSEKLPNINDQLPSVIAYQKINWELVRKAFFVVPNLFENVIAHVDNKSQPLDEQEPIAYEEIPRMVDNAMRTAIQRIVNSTTVSEDIPMFDLGLDSLGAVELRQILSTSLHVKIPATSVFEHPTIREMKRFLVDEVAKSRKIATPGEATLSDLNQPQVERNSVESINGLDGAEVGDDFILAVTGMACRFPKSRTLSEFWHNLSNGVDCMSGIPNDRWDIDEFYNENPNTPASMYIREGGFCDDIDFFDAQLFGISKIESVTMDPQQKIFLEVGYEAMVDAGLLTHNILPSQPTITRSTEINSTNSVFHTSNSLNSSYSVNERLTDTAVVVGVCLPDWTYSLDINSIQLHSGTGLVPSLVSNRFSYCFGMKGPSLSVDTACSASLVALDIAVTHLKNGDCCRAIVGGVQLNLSPFPFVAFCKARLLSPSGRCKTFDASADGYGRGEGCGVVVVERIRRNAYLNRILERSSSDEQMDRDVIRGRNRVWGAIRGTAIGHHGKGANLIAPNGSSQQQVIRRALKNSRIETSEISYFETHGTGTALGDPIEFSAIQSIFAQSKEQSSSDSFQHAVILGAGKSNIGHLEGAAGIAGLIKTILSLSQRIAPPIVHFKTLNPNIESNGTNFHYCIPTQNVPIHDTKSSRRKSQINQMVDTSIVALPELCGCLSSFGFGGSLAHAVVSAPELSLTPIMTSQSNIIQRECVFLFTGQGSQIIGLCQELFIHQSVYRQAFTYISDLTGSLIKGIDLCSYIYPSIISSDRDDDTVDASLLDEVLVIQLALFAIQLALVELLKSKDIIPNIVLGHSIGELAAAVACDGLNIEQAIQIIALRHICIRSNQAPEPQGMMAIRLSEEEAQIVLDEFKFVAESNEGRSVPMTDAQSIWIAAVNGPQSIVLSGYKSKLNEFIEFYKERKGRPLSTVFLSVQNAYHTPLMEKAKIEFADKARDIFKNDGSNWEKLSNHSRKKPTQFISTVTGNILNYSELKDPSYWCFHMVKPVQLWNGLKALPQNASSVIEIGPKSQFKKSLHELSLLFPHTKWFSLDTSISTSSIDDSIQRMKESCIDDNNTIVFTAPIFTNERMRFPLPKFTKNRANTGSNESMFNNIENNEKGVIINETESQLRALISQIFMNSTGIDWESLDHDSLLSESGLDSLSLFTFRDEIRSQLSIEIPIAFFASRNLSKDQVERFLISHMEAQPLGHMPDDLQLHHDPHQLNKLNLLPVPLPNINKVSQNGRLLSPRQYKKSSSVFSSPWLEQLAKPRIKLRLICFPYGGGSTDVFAAWQQLLPSTIEIIPVLFPGRSVRFQEDSLDDIHEAASLFFASSIELFTSSIPYAFVGVSVGAIIAYEVAVLINHNEDQSLFKPVHLFPICCPHPRVYQLATVRAAEVYRKLNRSNKQKSTGQQQGAVSTGKPNVSIELSDTGADSSSQPGTSDTPNASMSQRQAKGGGMMSLREVVDIMQEDVKRKRAIRNHEIMENDISEFQNVDDIRRKTVAREFVMDFLQAANFRGVERIRENPEFADAWASVFSGDAAMALNYDGRNCPQLNDIPITSIEGSIDAVSRMTLNSMKDWFKYSTSKRCRYVLIEGGDHYLVHGKAKEAIQIILEDLSQYLELPTELKSVSEDSNNIMRKWYNRFAVSVLRRIHKP